MLNADSALLNEITIFILSVLKSRAYFCNASFSTICM